MTYTVSIYDCIVRRRTRSSKVEAHHSDSHHATYGYGIRGITVRVFRGFPTVPCTVYAYLYGSNANSTIADAAALHVIRLQIQYVASCKTHMCHVGIVSSWLLHVARRTRVVVGMPCPRASWVRVPTPCSQYGVYIVTYFLFPARSLLLRAQIQLRPSLLLFSVHASPLQAHPPELAVCSPLRSAGPSCQAHTAHPHLAPVVHGAPAVVLQHFVFVDVGGHAGAPRATRLSRAALGYRWAMYGLFDGGHGLHGPPLPHV